MRWNQPFPTWTQRLMVSFGVANLLGGAFGGLKTLLPAVIIGGIWTMVGWRGFPLIETIPPGSNDIARGVRTLRFRRLAAMLMPLSAFLCVPVVLITPEPYRLAAFAACCLPAMVALMVFAWSACPRCRKHFFLNGWRGSWTSHCTHCGQALYVAPPPDTSLERTRGR